MKEGLKKSVMKASPPTSSSSTKLLWMMSPLVLVCLVVSLASSMNSSGLVVAARNFPWSSWSPILVGRKSKLMITRKFSNLERLEAKMGMARAAIREALHGKPNLDDPDYVPAGPLYWNAKVFHRYGNTNLNHFTNY